ncbi:nucleotidyltransferase domain-containing protein [Hoeflea poritis]|uniref:Cyclic GMP-AMP synthase n=1 Tax=Hoeflea poritis TaxID=2993659 RepID=A0ABT4VV49_9HYPH|nr:nucleotidyltransferase [Hoeflea poritis]MDA4848598.1 nucleotidyltransferase [Hoeflea poritis]
MKHHSNNEKNKLLEKLVEVLDLPDTAYERAAARYGDLGEWLGRADSAVVKFEPHVYPQGSFRLGTAIRPLDESEEYDLDLACKLSQGATKTSHTQEQIKSLVGHEIGRYRDARGIKSQQEEKHRCWRLDYRDSPSFHMDIVPCVPAAEEEQRAAFTKMARYEGAGISQIASEHTVCITDNRLPNYRVISDDWLSSNPEGYAQWFEDRMTEKRAIALAEKAQIDDLPAYKRKTPLQRVVQILKRHRDQMFKNDEDSKPISVIITTLAARSYQGETTLESALEGVLLRMGDHVNASAPRVANPVNPSEDFADRWSMPQYGHLHLEENFWSWLAQAQTDFELLNDPKSVAFVSEQIQTKLGTTIPLAAIAGIIDEPAKAETIPSQVHVVTSENPKPWRSSSTK